MFRVSTVNLSADATVASTELGPKDCGELSAEKLEALLERFRGLDSVQNHDAEPSVVIVAKAGKYLVRTGRGKLFLYNARDSMEPYAELSAAEIVSRLDPAATVAAPLQAEEAYVSPAAKPAGRPNRAFAAVILAAALGLNAYSVRSFFHTDSVHEVPVIAFVTDAGEATNRQREFEGTYATGDRPGDRLIVVKADGSVQFSVIGAKGPAGTDRYRLGRRDGKFCLATNTSGVIDVLNLDSLVYYRDTYRRTR